MSRNIPWIEAFTEWWTPEAQYIFRMSKCLLRVSWCVTNGSRSELPHKMTGMLVVSPRDVNCRFWSHLRCLGWKDIIPISPSLIYGSPPGNGCEEDQGIQDWFNLLVFVEYSQISKPTVKSNSHFVRVNISILIFIKSVENISSLLDLERGQHSNKLKLQEIRITLKRRPVTYSHITAPKKKIARAFHVLARPPNFPLPFPQRIANLRSRSSVSLFCVERHGGTELWPTFPRNFIFANKKSNPETFP